ncbi:cbb3-type cytochrome c oxidase subunit I [Flavobacterium sp. XGLA_31]|uniref:cbb3-type cytochrome c oxidase subunit I n=1 Tax=Flavobacterium sp. XGLA_31 TaxID=3447666 RepID=UPI003F3DE9B9
MKNQKYALSFLALGLICLMLALLCGFLAGLQYLIPDFIKSLVPFSAMRPLHTLFVISWIVLSAIGGVYYYILSSQSSRFGGNHIRWHFWIFFLSGIGITYAYLTQHFGGKEYLEFPIYFYFPIMLGWILLAITYCKTVLPQFKSWPVYYWMWGTGIFFMIYHFTEAHLWMLPYFKGQFVQNLMLQWKAGGSYVGSWNMLVYGTALYVMSKINEDNSYAFSSKAFFFYFLGLTNLMLGWAHHTYIVPSVPWIRYLAYAISMSEWIILFSIIYDWKTSAKQRNLVDFPLARRLIRLADFWVLLNIILALLISIPAVNLFTHGTHITVAHSMGSTIGINTLILLASITYILEKNKNITQKNRYNIEIGMKIFHFSFLLFWILLLVMGVKKGYWQLGREMISFGAFQESLHLIYLFFVLSGLGLLTGLYLISYTLLIKLKEKIIT